MCVLEKKSYFPISSLIFLSNLHVFPKSVIVQHAEEIYHLQEYLIRKYREETRRCIRDYFNFLLLWDN